MFYNLTPVVMRRPSQYVNCIVLTANVEEKQVIPTGYNIVLVSATDNIYCKVGGASVTASIPADTTDGTASELAPTAFYLNGDETYISCICSNNATLTLSYYRQV